MLSRATRRKMRQNPSMSGSIPIVVGNALLLKRVKMNAQQAPESAARA